MIEIAVAAIGSGGLIAAAALPLMWRSHGRQLGEIKEQVANSHGTNLRDDLDFIRDLVLDVKTDVAWVRRDHVDLTHRVALLEGAA